MRNLALRPSLPVARLAREIARDSVDYLAGLDSWLRRNFRYRDEFEEIVRTPEFMLADMQYTGMLEGDCDDVATFAASVLYNAGIPARLVAIRTTPDPNFDHVFVEAKPDGEYYFQHIDPTVSSDTRVPEFERMEVWI